MYDGALEEAFVWNQSSTSYKGTGSCEWRRVGKKENGMNLAVIDIENWKERRAKKETSRGLEKRGGKGRRENQTVGLERIVMGRYGQSLSLRHL